MVVGLKRHIIGLLYCVWCNLKFLCIITDIYACHAWMLMVLGNLLL